MIINEEKEIVEYGGNLTIACKVHGHPKPKIQWKDENGQLLTSEVIDFLSIIFNLFVVMSKSLFLETSARA